jgi:Domain of unknown function (DUF4062)
MQELAPERHAVREAIESLRLTPVMFELGARPYPPRALHRAYLEQSDVFVGLYWESYGWVAPGEELSGLEDEYRLSGDRPKLIYIKAPAPNRQPRLTEMIASIQGDDVSYRPFGGVDELRTLVADDLAVLLTERFAASAEAPVGPPPTGAHPPAAATGDAAHRSRPGRRGSAASPKAWSPRRAPSTWIGQLPSSSSPIQWPSGCATAVMDQQEPRNPPGLTDGDLSMSVRHYRLSRWEMRTALTRAIAQILLVSWQRLNAAGQRLGMAPSCRSIPRSSRIAHRSAIWPSTSRYMAAKSRS